MHALVAAAVSAIFRVVPLACSGERLVVAGGGVLRIADGATCSRFAPGRAAAIALDADGRVAPVPDASDARPAADLPRSAYLLAPAHAADADQTEIVNVRIDVAVPPRTPPGDDVYLSTERSNWSPSEVRMNRVDARHFRLDLQVHRGARVAFRVTRGSYATLERDASRALPPAHVAGGEPGAQVTVTVAAWADID
ncbi:hypothetical protein WPS_29570 [Vulcanimicrobium alpinum]|uniref:Uncharacterized protein n=1 Tax=Vulcanimicrobium alpinum TaxID=3016050 RepID=A0AAN1XYE2_UNVUL|nr:hypothetical protein [Vulcanimicrobium alpinum]BDE07681.1 hypothetical protein WPS_29570 [Vulcanimicrobium alpinum]